MELLPESDELRGARRPSDSSADSDSPSETRPRIFSFPSPKSLRKIGWRGEGRRAWKRDRWSTSNANRSDLLNFAERSFLACPESQMYQRLRTFSVSKRGCLVDNGYSYRHRDNSPSRKETAEPVFRQKSKDRRATCPEIWLSRADSYVPDQVLACDIWFSGSAGVGKTCLITQLLKELGTDAAKMDLIYGRNYPTISIVIDNQEVHLEFREANEAETITKDDKKYFIEVVTYSVSSRKSLSQAADLLFSYTKPTKTKRRPEQSAKSRAILVGNKTDLQRMRKVRTAEGKTLAKIYRCNFAEVSADLPLHVDVLLQKMISELHNILYGKVGGNVEPEVENEESRKVTPRIISGLVQNGRRLARSCESIYSRLKSLL